DVVQFSTADTVGVNKTLVQGSSNGTKVTAIYASCSDGTQAHLTTVQLQRSGVNYGGVAVNVPTNSGFTSAAPPVNMFSTTAWPGLPIDSDGNPFLFLQSTLDLLVATYASTLTAAAVLNLQAVRGDF